MNKERFYKVFLLIFVTFVFLINFNYSTIGRAKALGNTAKSMIVIERDSLRVLAKKDEKLKLPMASTTKIATAITVIESVKNLDVEVTIPIQAVGVEGSSIYLENGEKLTVRDLLYGLMLRSGNDCAVALALSCAGSIDKFAEMMNEMARRVGATNTHFVNPHGLHDDNHYTTAYDLAIITAHALKNPVFAEIVNTKRYETAWQGREYNRVLTNKNKILSSYEGGNGVKTGYTKKAGRCLVSSATRKGMTVIAVVLNCSPMFKECSALMDYAFSNYELTDLSAILYNTCAPVTDGKQDEVRLGLNEKASYPLKNGEMERVSYEVKDIESLSAPVKKGQEMGKIEFYLENQLLFTRKLYTIKEVEQLSVIDRMREIVKEWNG